MNKTIAVKEIRKLGPCRSRLKVFLSAYPGRERVTWREIIESNGLDDLLWLLGEIDTGLVRELACDYAEHVLPVWEKKYPDDDRPRRCLEVTRAYLRGEATREEREKARAAVYAAADAAYAVYDAAYAAYTAADADADAAYAAADAAYAAAAADYVVAADAAENSWQIEHTLEKIEG